jgi:hypothetical protein
LSLSNLDRTGDDYSQNNCWDENENFKAEPQNAAGKEKECCDCHFHPPIAIALGRGGLFGKEEELNWRCTGMDRFYYSRIPRRVN